MTGRKTKCYGDIILNYFFIVVFFVGAVDELIINEWSNELILWMYSHKYIPYYLMFCKHRREQKKVTKAILINLLDENAC